MDTAKSAFDQIVIVPHIVLPLCHRLKAEQLMHILKKYFNKMYSSAWDTNSNFRFKL